MKEYIKVGKDKGKHRAKEDIKWWDQGVCRKNKKTMKQKIYISIYTYYVYSICVYMCLDIYV